MSFKCFSYALDTGALGAGQEPAVNPGIKDGQCHPGLCQQECCQELRAGLVTSAQHSVRPHLDALASLMPSSTGKTPRT